MQQAVGPEVWTAMRDLASGAPPMRARMARAGRLHASTVRDRAGRDRWPRPNYFRAELCWRNGDVEGTAAETAYAVACATEGCSPRGVLRRLGVIIAERRDEARASNAAAEARSVGAGARGECGTRAATRAAAVGDDGACSDLAMRASAQPDLASPDMAPSDSASPELVSPDFAALPPEDRVARLASFFSRQVGMVLVAAESTGGLLDKEQFDTLSGLIRLAEKFEALSTDEVAARQKRSDAEIAEILRRVDDRIVELARGHAEWLVARKPDG